ncbi:hypothetical protein [Variovorax boronicumulans]|uniref:hypothetical protein n=1 Tax=Variovorax boronicumulans TaxID=436515 RepID=UPI00214AD92E
MNDKVNFAAALPAVGGAHVVGNAEAIESPPPPKAMQLTEVEQGLYEEICEALRKAGIEHTTSGLAISFIVRTVAQYLAANERCEREGRTQASKNGWVASTPWAEDEKRLKMELGQWLPKACLTIPSLARVRKDTGEAGKQDDLFGDLVKHGTSLPGPQSRH